MLASLALVVGSAALAPRVRGDLTLPALADLDRDALGPFRLGMTIAELDTACRSIGRTGPGFIISTDGYRFECRESPSSYYHATCRGGTALTLGHSWGGRALRAQYDELERALKARYGPAVERRYSTYSREWLTWYPRRDRWVELRFNPGPASIRGDEWISIAIGTGTGWP